MRKRIAVVLAIVVIVMATCVGIADAAGRVVYMEDHTGSAWPVNTAQGFVDQYTGTNIVYGTCKSGYECARVYERRVSTSWAAYTCPAGWDCLGVRTWYTRIYVNPDRNGQAYGLRLRWITHELGHWRGITYHSAYCSNVMYYKATCPGGGMVGYRFSDPQKAILAKH